IWIADIRNVAVGHSGQFAGVLLATNPAAHDRDGDFAARARRPILRHDFRCACGRGRGGGGSKQGIFEEPPTSQVGHNITLYLKNEIQPQPAKLTPSACWRPRFWLSPSHRRLLPVARLAACFHLPPARSALVSGCAPCPGAPKAISRPIVSTVRNVRIDVFRVAQ